MKCPKCGSEKLIESVSKFRKVSSELMQRFVCLGCGLRFEASTQAPTSQELPPVKKE